MEVKTRIEEPLSIFGRSFPIKLITYVPPIFLIDVNVQHTVPYGNYI